MRKIELLDFDLIFQESRFPFSEVWKRATGSNITHVGVIVAVNGQISVLTSSSSVQYIKILDWIERGKGKIFYIKRLRTKYRKKLKDIIASQLLSKYLGLQYDKYLSMSDKKAYCSLLVWKIFQREFGIELAALLRLGELKLDDPYVLRKLNSRYKNQIPLDQLVIAPAHIFKSKCLQAIYLNKDQDKVKFTCNYLLIP